MDNKINVQYHEIAKMFCGALPIAKLATGKRGNDTNQDAYGEHVRAITQAIKSLPIGARLALKSAYIFSSKVPREDREDMFQELALAVLTVGTDSEKFAYTIARQDWRNWWAKYYTRSNYYGGSLNETVTDSDNNEVELVQLLSGTIEYERKYDGDIDGQSIYRQLPATIRPIVDKRLVGMALNAAERQALSRYVRKHGASLIMQA
jgi:hypothetical protein